TRYLLVMWFASALFGVASAGASAQAVGNSNGGSAGRGSAFTPVEMLPGAPGFQLKTLERKSIRLSDYPGKAVLLNFWATWCVPCNEEMPWLIAFQKQYGPKGLVVLGIAMDSSVEAIKKFTAKQEINFPIVLGSQAVADQYYVKGLPVSIFIDRNGRITDQLPGAAARSFIENEIQLALENGSRSSGK